MLAYRTRHVPVIRRRRRGPASGGGAASGLFALDFEPSISNAIETLNGESPVAKYVADGSGGMTRVAGPVLTASGTHTDLGDYHPFFGTGDHATNSPHGGYMYESGTSTILGSNDHSAIHLVMKKPLTSTATATPISVNGANPRWYIIYPSSGQLQTVLFDSSGNLAVQSSDIGYTPDGTWTDVWVFINRNPTVASGGLMTFVNGQQADTSAASTSALVGSLDGSHHPLSILGNEHQTTWRAELDGALIEVFSAADLGFPNTSSANFVAHAKTIAEESIARISGVYPSVATGTAVPTTMTRASAKHIRKDDSSGNTAYIQVAPGWSDVCRVYDSSTGLLHTGFRGENAVTTGAADSNNLAGTSWTHVALTSAALSSTQKGPVNGAYVSEVIADATTGSHYAHEAGGASASYHTCGCIVAAGDKSELKLTTTQVGSDAYAYFDLSGAGSVGTTGGTRYNSAYIRSLGVAFGLTWYECGFYYDSPAAAHEHWVQPVDTGEVDSYTGDGSTIDLYVAHYQHEEDSGEQLSSPIYTSGGTATRAADVLGGAADHWATGGAVDIRTGVIVPAAIDAGVDTILWEMNTGATDRIYLAIQTGSGVPYIYTRDGGVVQSTIYGTTSVVDGAHHEVRAVIKLNSVALYVDGAQEGTPDTSCTIPAVDTIHHGSNQSAAAVNSHAMYSHMTVYKA